MELEGGGGSGREERIPLELPIVRWDELTEGGRENWGGLGRVPPVGGRGSCEVLGLSEEFVDETMDIGGDGSEPDDGRDNCFGGGESSDGVDEFIELNELVKEGGFVRVGETGGLCSGFPLLLEESAGGAGRFVLVLLVLLALPVLLILEVDLTGSNACFLSAGFPCIALALRAVSRYLA